MTSSDAFILGFQKANSSRQPKKSFVPLAFLWMYCTSFSMDDGSKLGTEALRITASVFFLNSNVMLIFADGREDLNSSQ